MATYNKKLKTLNVHLMLDGTVVTIEDTATDDMATRALNEFKNYETMHYETEGGGVKITNAIPYRAVQYIEVMETEATINKADPYGCEDGGGTEWRVYASVNGTAINGVLPMGADGNPEAGRYNAFSFVKESDAPNKNSSGISVYSDPLEVYLKAGGCGAIELYVDRHYKSIVGAVYC